MGIRKSILTSGGFASAIGICLATLSAGTLVVFSVIAAGVGFEEPSTAPSVARAARGGAPAAITFPSAGRTSAENQGSRGGDTSLLDVIGSAGSALDQSTAAAPANGLAQTAAPDTPGASTEEGGSDQVTDSGSEQVAAVVSDFGGDNALAAAAERSASRIKRGGNTGPRDDPKPKGKKDEGDDGVAARKDEEDDPDHADDDDDDDDSDSSGSRDGSGLGGFHANTAKAKAKAKSNAKGHSKSVHVRKGGRDKGHDSHHGSHSSDS
jgi:hypothetical protein